MGEFRRKAAEERLAKFEGVEYIAECERRWPDFGFTSKIVVNDDGVEVREIRSFWSKGDVEHSLRAVFDVDTRDPILEQARLDMAYEALLTDELDRG
jgi:hypothetical protein